MRIAAIDRNDFINGTGVCVSLWVQGCPIHCPGCHNKDLWDFKGAKGRPVRDVIKSIDLALTANGIKRNFSILGGEPLCKENMFDVATIIKYIRYGHGDIKIHLWTGYNLEDFDKATMHFLKECVFPEIDYLIVGPYIEAERDITLKWRGSRNQKILERGKDF